MELNGRESGVRARGRPARRPASCHPEPIYRGAFGTPPRKLQFRAVFAITDQTAYVFTFTAPPAAFDEHVKASDAVIKSVEWNQRKH